MMKIQCPNCRSIHRVDESKIPVKGIYANCPRCQSRFFVEGTSHSNKDLHQRARHSQIRGVKQGVIQQRKKRIEEDSKQAMFRSNPSRTGVFKTKGLQQLNRLKWKFNTSGAIDSSPVEADGVLYVGSNSGNFYAVDIETGKEKWRFEAFVSNSSVVADGLVYFIDSRGRTGGKLHAVCAKTGQEKWRFDNAGPYSSPAFFDGIIYIGSITRLGEETYIESHALHAKNGNEKWRFEQRANIIESSLTDSSHSIADEVVCFASYDGHLYALDIQTGRKSWIFRKIIREGCVPAIANEVVYVQSMDRNIYAVDIKTGLEKWLFSHQRSDFTASLAISDEALYFGAGTRFLYAVDKETRREKWKFKAGKLVGTPPSIADGTIYFGSYDGYLYAVDIETGQEKWKFNTGGAVRCSPFISDGVIYFGSNDGFLYALE
jgi:predicted Zn finger-like uncharacterized protein